MVLRERQGRQLLSLWVLILPIYFKYWLVTSHITCLFKVCLVVSNNIIIYNRESHSCKYADKIFCVNIFNIIIIYFYHWQIMNQYYYFIIIYPQMFCMIFYFDLNCVFYLVFLSFLDNINYNKNYEHKPK
jgi:hypothetical protein